MSLKSLRRQLRGGDNIMEETTDFLNALNSMKEKSFGYICANVTFDLSEFYKDKKKHLVNKDIYIMINTQEVENDVRLNVTCANDMLIHTFDVSFPIIKDNYLSNELKEFITYAIGSHYQMLKLVRTDDLKLEDIYKADLEMFIKNRLDSDDIFPYEFNITGRKRILKELSKEGFKVKSLLVKICTKFRCCECESVIDGVPLLVIKGSRSSAPLLNDIITVEDCYCNKCLDGKNLKYFFSKYNMIQTESFLMLEKLIKLSNM